MSSFSVSAAQLQDASRSVSGVDCRVTLSGQGGAASGTPAAGAWSQFADAADGVGAKLDVAAEDLARALSLAARAYQLADESAASSLEAGR